MKDCTHLWTSNSSWICSQILAEFAVHEFLVFLLPVYLSFPSSSSSSSSSSSTECVHTTYQRSLAFDVMFSTPKSLLILLLLSISCPFVSFLHSWSTSGLLPSIVSKKPPSVVPRLQLQCSNCIFIFHKYVNSAVFFFTSQDTSVRRWRLGMSTTKIQGFNHS